MMACYSTGSAEISPRDIHLTLRRNRDRRCGPIIIITLIKESQGYKAIYSPVTFEFTQEFVLETFHSYSALTNRQNITINLV